MPFRLEWPRPSEPNLPRARRCLAPVLEHLRRPGPTSAQLILPWAQARAEARDVITFTLAMAELIDHCVPVGAKCGTGAVAKKQVAAP